MSKKIALFSTISFKYANTLYEKITNLLFDSPTIFVFTTFCMENKLSSLTRSIAKRTAKYFGLFLGIEGLNNLKK